MRSFFSAAQEIGGNGEKGVEREREGTGEIFPPVTEEMRESGKGQLCIEKWTKPFPEGVLNRPPSKCTHQ